jgi:purine catabolism regulator
VPVPLSWLLAEPDLGLRQLAGSSDGVVLTWAHAIELNDPSPWLAGGELVLTTGLRLPRALVEQAAYVDRLAAAKVAALAFGVGVRFAEVPRGIIERCTQIGLPLLEVPLPTPFVAITQRVAHRLAQDQQDLLQRAVTFQQALTRRTLREGSRGLVAGLAKELSAPVALLDEHLRPLAVSSRARALVGGVTAALEQTASDRTLGATHRIEIDGRPVDLHSLAGRAAHRGWLVVALDAPGPHERLLVNHAVSLATLHLDRPRELEEARAQVGATVLALLLEHAPAEPAVVRHLHHLGFSANAAVRVLSIQTPRPMPDAARAAVATALSTAGMPNAIVRTPAGIVLLVPDRDVSGALGNVRAVASGVDAGPVSIGVSAAVGAERSAHALVQARNAARTARRERKPVEWFEALTLEAILDDEAVRDRVSALAGASLAPLLEAPSPHDRGLVATLAAFLDHNGSWESASRALGIHRHTLRNRIARVEELTGLSLDVAHHRVVLTLALATLPPT